MPTPDFPKSISISARISTVTNAFTNSVIPRVEPTQDQLDQALKLLGMKEGDIRCAYCGDPATEWDHLSPLVENKKPTGFITEIFNLIPACGKCNQSKRNQPWESWIRSTAPKSPATRRIADLDTRIEMIRTYENWASEHRTKLNVTALAQGLWEEHEGHRVRIAAEMNAAQQRAALIRSMLREQVPGST
jgi:hypothetical protein